MAAGSEDCACGELKSRRERSDHRQQCREWCFGCPRHADPTKVYLGQVRLSIAHGPLEILKEQGSVTAHRWRGIPYRNENAKKTTGLYAARDHARGEHYCDHTGR